MKEEWGFIFYPFGNQRRRDGRISMRRLILFSLLIGVSLILSCSFGLRMAGVDSWLNKVGGTESPTVDISGEWQDTNTGMMGWGEGYFDQKGRNITGSLGDYVIKGVVSGNTADLVIIYFGSVHFTAKLELINNSLRGFYYSYRDEKQSTGYNMALKRIQK
jgi:hypothetical protein